MVTVFFDMNSMYTRCFGVTEAEASEPGLTNARSTALRDRFIFDNQLHYVLDNFSFGGPFHLREYVGEQMIRSRLFSPGNRSAVG